MSDYSVANIANAREIPCMLLPMVGHTILVPTTSIAEMSSTQPFETLDNSPDWFMGFYQWRGIKVPVISLECLNGEGDPTFNMQGRVAVLNNTGEHRELPFIAIHTQGIPRMSRVAEEDISENTSATRRPFDLMPVKVGMEEFYMPDVAAIEKAYVNTVLNHP